MRDGSFIIKLEATRGVWEEWEKQEKQEIGEDARFCVFTLYFSFVVLLAFSFNLNLECVLTTISIKKQNQPKITTELILLFTTIL